MFKYEIRRVRYATNVFFLTVLSSVGPADCGRRGSGRVRDAEGVHQALAAVRKTDRALLGKHLLGK